MECAVSWSAIHLKYKIAGYANQKDAFSLNKAGLLATLAKGGIKIFRDERSRA
jgi:hypothetical protein